MASADAETLDFEAEEDELMDDEAAGDVDAFPTQKPRIMSTITGGADGPKNTEGRGFREDGERSRLTGRDFDTLETHGGPGPQRPIEGWIVLVTGVHEEAQEEDLQNAFGEFGEIKNLHLNLDRRTGFVKGYALIEYTNFEEALAAITAMDGAELLTQTIHVDWAFSNGSFKKREEKGHSKDIETNVILESGQEMLKEPNELVAETLNCIRGLPNDDRTRMVYSRSRLEALRFIGIKEQNERWHAIYQGLGPELSSEYDSLANSNCKKNGPPNYNPQRQPSGRRENTNMIKTNHVMEVANIRNSSSNQHWVEEGFTGLDEEYSQDSDSDEDYDGILKPAFHVDGEPDFESGPPEDGMEYLRRVRWEASQIPKVKVAKLDKSKVNNNQSDYMPKIPDIAKCPEHLLPSKGWEELFLAQFEKLRLALSSSQPQSFSGSDGSSGNPTLSAILGMEPVTRISMLRRHIASLSSSNTISHGDCLWLFALCASVDAPLDADSCASLRCMLRKCASLRAEKTEKDEEVVWLNILATISGKYFKQLDS